MNTKIPNIEVIRSLWRRVKQDIKVRDLKPVKDVKGGGGVTGQSKSITGGTGTTDTHANTHTDGRCTDGLKGNQCDCQQLHRKLE